MKPISSLNRNFQAHFRLFSLVEFLVVISILTILMSLLQPSLLKTLEHAKRVTCANHHRLVNVGLQMYANENGDLLPPPGSFTFIVYKRKDEAMNLGHLFETGILSSGDLALLSDPSYENINSQNTTGVDGWFNQLEKYSSQGWQAMPKAYKSTTMNYGVASTPVPEHWENGTNWWSSNPDGKLSVSLNSSYASITQPIRTACMWNNNELELPTGKMWLNAYTHDLKGINMTFNDGSLKWIDRELLFQTHGSGFVHHFRSKFWRFGKEYKDY